jgi:putative transposase
LVACERMPKRLDPFRFLLISVAGWMNQQQRDVIEYLREENRVLRTHLGNRRIRFTDDQRRSLAAKAKLVGRKLLSELSTIVTPETLLRWHGDLIACKYDGSKRRNPGRPAPGKEIEELVVRLAKENRSWVYLRIRGALSNLGYEVSRNTIANILKRNGIESAPDRVRKTTWREFLTQHWELVGSNSSTGGLYCQTRYDPRVVSPSDCQEVRRLQKPDFTRPPRNQTRTGGTDCPFR